MSNDDVTLEEIRDQPRAIEALLAELERAEADLLDTISGGSTVCFVGCGTSFYLAQTGSALLNHAGVGIAVPGSEVLASPDTLPEVEIDAIVPVSRSGESTETVRATEELIDMYPDASVVGITCSEGSSVYELSDVPVLSPAGSEESIVMTKSYSSMLVALEYLARLAAGETGLQERFADLPEESTAVVERAEQQAADLAAREDLTKHVFLGSGEYYGIASEAMLKFEELTLSWTKAYHALEFRHGPKSIADEETLVTVFHPGRASELISDLVDDVTDLGAETLVIGHPDDLETVDPTHEFALSSESGSLALTAPFFQFQGYYRAVERGLDPDNPQNLSQVVEL